MVAYEVILKKKGSFEGKKVIVQAIDVPTAFKKALGMQPNAGTWLALTAKVEASRMTVKFKHKGVRYA
jgi:hypothetical protein